MNNFKFRYVLPLMVFWFSCPWNYSNSLQAQTASERRNYLSKQIQKTEEILLQSEKEKMIFCAKDSTEVSVQLNLVYS